MFELFNIDYIFLAASFIIVLSMTINYANICK